MVYLLFWEFLQHSDKKPCTIRLRTDLFDVYFTLLLPQQRAGVCLQPLLINDVTN